MVTLSALMLNESLLSAGYWPEETVLQSIH